VKGAISGKDSRTPEQKQRDLDRAVRELRPRIEPLLRKGVPRTILKGRMLLWKRQYRLTDLTHKNGKIRAIINPQVDMFSTNEQQIGQQLERWLREAEKLYLASTGTSAQGSGNSDQLLAAKIAIAQGKPLPAGLTQDEMVKLIREEMESRQNDYVVDAGDYQLTIDRNGRLRVNALGPYIFRHLPGMAPQTIAPLPKTKTTGVFPVRGDKSEWKWIRSVNSQPSGNPVIKGLRSHVEVARAEGNLPANRVSQTLVDLTHLTTGSIRIIAEIQYEGASGVVSEAEITFGRMAPMAVPSSAQAGTGRERSAVQRDSHDAARRARHGSYTVIFNTLSEAVREHSDALVKLPGGQGDALKQVAAKYELWRNAAFNNGKIREGNDVESLGQQLRDALVQLMAETRSRK